MANKVWGPTLSRWRTKPSRRPNDALQNLQAKFSAEGSAESATEIRREVITELSVMRYLFCLDKMHWSLAFTYVKIVHVAWETHGIQIGDRTTCNCEMCRAHCQRKGVKGKEEKRTTNGHDGKLVKGGCIGVEMTRPLYLTKGGETYWTALIWRVKFDRSPKALLQLSHLKGRCFRTTHLMLVKASKESRGNRNIRR